MLVWLAIACAARVAPTPWVDVPLESGPVQVMTTEVTQADWRRLMGTDPSWATRCDPCPVERVSWYDAASYANALSRSEGLPACYELEGCAAAPLARRRPAQPSAGRTGLACEVARLVPDCLGYRLPSVAEWRSLAPLPDTTRRTLQQHAVFAGSGHRHTAPVASRAPNPHGLYDTLGNVDEWLHESRGPAADAPPEKQADPRWFVTAASCFASSAKDLRDPVAHEVEAGSWGRSCLGFRLVRTLPSDAP